MYQISCDGYILYDPRDEELVLNNKRCKIGSNICGEASFLILANHPHYGRLSKLRSVFEIKQGGNTIFRGRMTDDSRDFDNIKLVDLEGAMAYLNDSVIRPFSFPDDFPDAESAENIVEYFFRWLIERHNSQVQPFQQFKVGNVTVSDHNNYIKRSNTDYASSWETIKDALFDSSLGGYLCIRYEADGNYLDYLADYVDGNGNKIVNSQAIEFGKNLLDFQNESDSTETYSAVIPLGAKNDSSQLTIADLPDGYVTHDIVKAGDVLYSISAVAAYGFIVAPIEETTFEDITEAQNLQASGVAFLKNKSVGFRETISFTAIDLNLTDDEIAAFRIYKYVATSSEPHNVSGVYPLSQLDIDMDNPQNTKITVGETRRTLVDKTNAMAKKVTVMQKNYVTNESMSNEITQIQTLISQTEENILLSVEAQYNDLNDAIALINVDVGAIELNVSEMGESLGTISAELDLKVSRDDNNQIVSMINASADIIELTADRIKIASNKFNLEDGHISSFTSDHFFETLIDEGTVTCSANTSQGTKSVQITGNGIIINKAVLETIDGATLMTVNLPNNETFEIILNRATGALSVYRYQ